MKRKVRLGRGERRAQAVVAIREYERQRLAWSVPDLARTLGVLPAQAYLLVDAMYRAGELTRGTRTCLVEGPVLTGSRRAA